MIAGSVEYLEISVQWPNLLSGKLAVVVRGLHFTLQPLTASGERDPMQSVSESISSSTAEAAQSFIVAEGVHDLGVGPEQSPDSVILQNLLEKMLAGLTVEIARATIVLQKAGTRHEMIVHMQDVNYRPNSSGAVVESSGLQLRLRSSSQRERRHSTSDTLHRTQSGSSRSTSSSSADAFELTQSTIFEHDEARSMYMSALGSSSMYQSALQGDAETDKHEASDDDREVTLVQSPDGFTALIRQDASGMYIDLSCQDVLASFIPEELVSLVSCLHPYVLSKVQDVNHAPGGSKVNLSLRCNRLHITLDLEESKSQEQQSPSEDKLGTLEVNLYRLSMASTISGCIFKVNDGAVSYRDLVFLGRTRTGAEGLLDVTLQSSGTIEAILDGLIIQSRLHEIIPIITATSKLASDLKNAWSTEDRPVRHCDIPRHSLSSENLARLSCPRIKFVCISDTRPLCFQLHTLQFMYQSPSGKTRYSLEFSRMQLSLGGETILESEIIDTNIVDLTIMYDKPVPRTLEFLHYQSLFDSPERDAKKEQDTLQALKQKAKDSADQMIRASLGAVHSRLTSEKLRLLAQTIKVVQVASTTYPVQTGTLPGSAVRTFLAEIRGWHCELDIGPSILQLNCRGVSLFGVQELKGIDAFSMEISSMNAQALTDNLGSTKIITEGHHRNSPFASSKQKPVLTVRGRRNHGGDRPNVVRVRLGLTDIQIDYHTEMEWLDHTLAFCKSSLVDFQSTDTSKAPSSMMWSLAIDLSNSCIGLNPYATSARGLLYFRQSAVEIAVFPNQSIDTIQVHAGVLDLFIIDNIEGGPNDTTVRKRDKKDPVTSALLNLGFVKVASAETVEIIVTKPEAAWATASCFSINLAGAILTLTTCADSTATLISLVTMLRLPVSISDELKYKIASVTDKETPLDVFGSIEEDAYKPVIPGSTSRVQLSSVSSDAPSNLDIDGAILVVEDDSQPSTMAMIDEHFVSHSVMEHDWGQNNEGHRQQRLDCKISARNCFVIWNLHDGYDWERTRQRISLAVDNALAKAKKLGQDEDWERGSDSDEDTDSTSDSNEIGDLLFNSIYIALPSGVSPQDLTKSINLELAQARMSDDESQTTATYTQNRKKSPEESGQSLRLGRSKMHKVRMEASGITSEFEYMAADEGDVLYHLSLKVRDLEIFDNVSTSTWRKFLTYHRAIGARDEGSNMMDLDVLNVRPVASLAAAELSLRLAVLPLRLHVDQDTLEFITRFFEFRDEDALVPLVQAEEIFIQKLDMQAIQVQIDYKPKRVDYKSLRTGRTTEFKNFFILEDSNMVLKHVILYGICGFARVFQHLNDIWLANIKSEQLASVLAGVAPLRSFASFSGSLRNLIMVPVNEYRKDGRIVPGIRKGLSSFARSTGSEAVRLGAKLAVGTQGFLESAETLIQNTGEASGRTAHQHAVSMYANQPRDLRQGVSQAMSGMTRNILTAKDTIVSLPRSMEDQTNTRGAVEVAARSVPVAVIRPLIGTTEMFAKTLLGLRNTMNPDQRRLNDDKYK